MATNKHATIRYQALDRCFRNTGRRYYINDLIEACNKAIWEYTGIDDGIKRRQIFEDIKFMESSQGWSVPLDHKRDGHKVYFKYTDSKFSINNQPLNETEENQLKEALLTLSRFKGMPQFEWVDEITARLDSGLGLSQNKKKIIEFEQNSYLKGLEHITPLYNAILYEKALEVEYKSFKQENSQTIIFHSYFLKQYNNRWFVFGRGDETEYVLNLALDRIIKLESSTRKYKANKEIDFEEYFEDIIGVTLDQTAKIEKVILKVSNNLYPYIQTKPIHGSQRLKGKHANHTLITLDVIPNYEFLSLLLSYGEGVEVLKPKFLRNKIFTRLKTMENQYSENSVDVLHSKV